MAPDKITRKKDELRRALVSLESALQINLSGKNEIEVDVLKNGQIQKFEYTLELCWKTLQEIYKEKGALLNYPKDVFRERFQEISLTEEQKIRALVMIDDRNVIAHEYKDYIINIIWPRLFDYLELLKSIAIV